MWSLFYEEKLSKFLLYLEKKPMLQQIICYYMTEGISFKKEFDRGTFFARFYGEISLFFCVLVSCKNVLISPSKTKKWLVKKSCKTTIVDTFPVEGSQSIVKYSSKLNLFDVNFNSNEFCKFLQRFPPKPGCVYRFILLGLTFILTIKYIKSLIFVTCNSVNVTKKWC